MERGTSKFKLVAVQLERCGRDIWVELLRQFLGQRTSGDEFVAILVGRGKTKCVLEFFSQFVARCGGCKRDFGVVELLAKQLALGC
jgi:hypothetical protein